MRIENKLRRNISVPAVAVASVLSLGLTPVLANQSQSNRSQQQSSTDNMMTPGALKGTRVVDSQNREIGTISNIFIDPQSGKIARADIDFNLPGADREYSVSWDKLSMQRKNGDMVAKLDQAIVDRVSRGESANASWQTRDRTYSQQQRNRDNSFFGLGDNNDNQRKLSSADLSPEGVRKVQQKLNKEGFDAGHVNGQWNQDTQTAIKNFQRSKGLQTTGKIDERTLDELGLDRDELRAYESSNMQGSHSYNK
jgi:hypothetical protein